MNIEQRLRRIEEKISKKKKVVEGFDPEYTWTYRDSEYEVNVSQSSNESLDNETLRYKGVIRFSGVRSLGVTKEQFKKALLNFYDEIGADY